MYTHVYVYIYREREIYTHIRIYSKIYGLWVFICIARERCKYCLVCAWCMCNEV